MASLYQKLFYQLKPLIRLLKGYCPDFKSAQMQSIAVSIAHQGFFIHQSTCHLFLRGRVDNANSDFYAHHKIGFKKFAISFVDGVKKAITIECHALGLNDTESLSSAMFSVCGQASSALICWFKKNKDVTGRKECLDFNNV